MGISSRAKTATAEREMTALSPSVVESDSERLARRSGDEMFLLIPGLESDQALFYRTGPVSQVTSESRCCDLLRVRRTLDRCAASTLRVRCQTTMIDFLDGQFGFVLGCVLDAPVQLASAGRGLNLRPWDGRARLLPSRLPLMAAPVRSILLASSLRSCSIRPTPPTLRTDSPPSRVGPPVVPH